MITKHLVRGNDVPADTEVFELSTSEFITTSLQQIARTAESLIGTTETEPVLDAMSDILELMHQYLVAKNIQTDGLFEHASELRNIKGTFDKKVAVSKE